MTIQSLCVYQGEIARRFHFETGNALLASELAADWVFWKTGNVDILTVAKNLNGTLVTVAMGWLAILVAGILAAWRFRRKAPPTAV